MMPTLKQIVEENHTRSGRAFDWCVQFLIVLSLVTFSMDTLPNLADSTRSWLHVIEVVSVVAFSVEYLLRCYVSRPLSKYVFSFFGIIDLASVLPFYIGGGLDLRSLRAFRLLRLFRIFKLARYSAATRRFHRALKIAKEEILMFFCLTAIVLFLAAAGIYHFEHDAQPETFSSVFDSLWWAVATLTTVGYGDVYPITAGGRVFTFFVLLIGLGIVSVPSGLVASALSKAREMEEHDR